MINFVQPGEVMEYQNSGSAIDSGDVVALGDHCGIAMVDIAASSGKGSLALSGVFSLTSDTGTAYSQGDPVYWDAGNSRVTKTAAGNTPIGVAFEAKTSGGTTAKVKLQPNPKRAAFVADAASGSAAEINALRDALVAAGLMKNA